MNDIKNVEISLLDDMKFVSNLEELNDFKVKYMGKKGLISELSSHIKEVDSEERKNFGQSLNDLKMKFQDFYDEKRKMFEEEQLNAKLLHEAIDITLPATKIPVGSPNILEKIIEEIEELLISMGFSTPSFSRRMSISRDSLSREYQIKHSFA